MKLAKLRIISADDNFKYPAEAIEDGGRYFYRVGHTTIEITELEFNRVVKNPRLYYFSTALKLHFLIQKGLARSD